MNEKGILFSAPMVLSNRMAIKNQTRRIVHPVPPDWIAEFGYTAFTPEGHISGRGTFSEQGPAERFFRLPYGVSGDLIYVKEATWIWCKRIRVGITPRGRQKFSFVPVGNHVRYCADHPSKPNDLVDQDPDHIWKYKSARFMPKWAARDRYKLIGTRVERLTCLSEEDAIGEGIERNAGGHFRIYGTDNFTVSPVESYRSLWETLHGPNSWRSDVWVWVVRYDARSQAR